MMSEGVRHERDARVGGRRREGDMKVIKKGHEKKHWIFNVRIHCDLCDAIYRCESDADFRSHATSPTKVTTRCPECGHTQTTHKVPVRGTTRGGLWIAQ